MKNSQVIFLMKQNFECASGVTHETKCATGRIFDKVLMTTLSCKCSV